MDDRFFIYLIGQKNTLRYPYDKCYLYFGNNLEVEWNRCSNANNKIGRYIREYRLNFDDHMMIIFFGSLNQCREKYAEFRPTHGIGLNDDNDQLLFEKKVNTHSWQDKPSVKKPYEMTRAEYKEWLKNKDKENENKGKGSGFNFKNQLNPSAALWKLTDPDGNEHIVEHGIRNFCMEQNISEFTLKDHLGEVIKEPKIGDPKKCNGFKPKNEEQLQRRLNTIGWKAERLSEKKPRYRKDWQRDLGIKKYVRLRP